MRRQVATLASVLAGLALAFVAGTAIASHFSSNGSHARNPSWFGTGGLQGRTRLPGPFGNQYSGIVAFGRVTKIAGDSITVTAFGGNSETITVNSSTSYTKRDFTTSGPSSSPTSLSSLTVNSTIVAQGSKSKGTFVAKSISIMSQSRFHFGQRSPWFGHSPSGSGAGSGHI